MDMNSRHTNGKNINVSSVDTRTFLIYISIMCVGKKLHGAWSTVPSSKGLDPQCRDLPCVETVVICTSKPSHLMCIYIDIYIE